MLKNKIDFIAKQCPILHEYLDNLPPQYVKDLNIMGDEIKKFFDIKYYALETSSLHLSTIKSLESPDYNCELLYGLVKKVLQAVLEDKKIIVIDYQGSKYVHFMNP